MTPPYFTSKLVVVQGFGAKKILTIKWKTNREFAHMLVFNWWKQLQPPLHQSVAPILLATSHYLSLLSIQFISGFWACNLPVLNRLASSLRGRGLAWPSSWGPVEATEGDVATHVISNLHHPVPQTLSIPAPRSCHQSCLVLAPGPPSAARPTPAPGPPSAARPTPASSSDWTFWSPVGGPLNICMHNYARH